MRASVSACVCACACACVCVRVCVRVRARARARPNGRAARRGPRRGWERTPQPCVRRRQSRNPRPRPRRRPHRGRHPPRGTPATSGGEHRRARRCSPSGGGGWKCRRLAPRHAMRPRTRATPSPPPRWRSREAARAHRWSTRGMRRTHAPLPPHATGAPRRFDRACGPSRYSPAAPESVLTSIMTFRLGGGGAPAAGAGWPARVGAVMPGGTMPALTRAVEHSLRQHASKEAPRLRRRAGRSPATTSRIAHVSAG